MTEVNRLRWSPCSSVHTIPGPDAESDVMGSAKLLEVLPAFGHLIGTIGKLCLRTVQINTASLVS